MEELTPRRKHRSAKEDFERILYDVQGRRLSRREVLAKGVALGLSVPAIGALLAACGGDDDDDDDTGAATTTGGATATSGSSGGTGSPTSGGGAVDMGNPAKGTSPTGGAPINGGTLTLLITDNVPDLDPQSAYDSTASAVFFGTYEMLIRLKGSDTFDYQPMLAESWDSNDDFSEWTFKIPAGVKFHDGSDCDAAAVVKSFQRFHKQNLGPANVIRRFVEDPDTDITAPDATTVVFKLKSGNEIFLAAMSSQYGPLVVSPAAVEEHKTADDEFAHEWFRENTAGTGPYRLKEYVQNERIVLERFEEYHGGWDGAHFDEIVFRIVTENATRRSLVEAGEADATTQNLTPSDVASLEEAGELVVLRYPSTAVYWTGINCGKITDAKVRQAMSYAFPYEDVRTGVYEGLLTEVSGPSTHDTRGYDPNGFIYQTDLEKAKALLEEAGFDTSQTLTYMISNASETDKATAQLMQAAFSDVGLNVEIVEQEGGTITDLMYGSAPAEDRPELFSWGWWPDYNDAWNEIYPNFYGESFQTAEGPNVHFYKSDRLDEILDSVEPGVTSDEYMKSMAEAQNILTELDPPAIYWGAVQWYTVMQPNIRGFVWNGIYINTYNVYDMYRVEL